ncbi:molecular chaperone HtpG, partial [Buchnera aphidicola (Kurisakia onigurumii)]|uniref:molecular chaperone HtpG n=1 Tax=Buchnera aphidicola TaxID=9 RepID=UPI0031B6CFE4
EKKIKKEKKIIWNQINKSNALWTLNKSEIKKEEYINFYKEFTNDTQPPLFWIHNKVEGNIEYTSLLYIPKKSPWDMWNRENKYGLKLYIKKVFIMENTNQLLPNYLRFVKGIVDANELPLNISREVLQKNKIVKNLKKTITKKTLNLLQKISKKNPEKYQKFWNEFGIIFKEGPAEDMENKNIILDLLRFTSINNKNIEQSISLSQYVKNMLPNQEKIYFITSDNYTSAKDSPHLELFKKKSIDVLLLSDRVDEWMMNYVHEFDGKNFQSINKQDNSIDNLIKKDKKEKIDENIINLLEKIKLLLKKDITDVKITHKLVNTPAVLVTDSNEMTTQMAKLFSSAGQKIPPLKYVLEINPKHDLIKKISLIKNEQLIQEWILFLFEQTLLIEKGSLENPNKFITRINKILTL